MKRVAIVGGGITGLAAAHRLQELCCSHDQREKVHIDLIESSLRLGGVLRTERTDSYLIEHSADMFTTLDRAAIELCERIGFADQLIGTNDQNQRAFIVQDKSLVPVPRGLNLMTPTDLSAIQQTSLLSQDGINRFLEEEHVPAKKDDGDESLESFAIRRFGDEAYRKIIQPLVGGIYTADPTRLSLKATLPQYLQMEATHGSVIAATRKRQLRAQDAEKSTSGARYNLFLAPRNGMSSLIDALKSKLDQVEMIKGKTVSKINRNGNGNKWELVTKESDNNQIDSQQYDAIVLTCPATNAAKILSGVNPELSALLNKIQYASSAILVQGYARDQIGHPLDGFGFVVPLMENRKILAGSFSSVKFAGRCSDETVLTRTFVGGGCQPELLDNSDQSLIHLAGSELRELLSISGEPTFSTIVRWNDSMPQYHLGHLELVDSIEKQVEAVDGMELAGKSFRGVGIPACIRSGENAAERIAQQIS